MNKILEYYNNNVPDGALQEIIHEQMKIITRIKSEESIDEDTYLQEFIKSNSRMNIDEMNNLWYPVIHEAFQIGIFYYKTMNKYGDS